MLCRPSNKSKNGKVVPLSPNEVERLACETVKVTRNLRLKQVREQERSYAFELVRQKKLKKAKCKREIVFDYEKGWQREVVRKLQWLQKRLTIHVVGVGNAQLKASQLVCAQADEARAALSVWNSVESAHSSRHGKAIHFQKLQQRENQAKRDSVTRQITRLREQFARRFDANQYEAATSEARKERTNILSVCSAQKNIPHQGPGITKFSESHFHHTIIRHTLSPSKPANDGLISLADELSGTTAALTIRKDTVEKSRRVEKIKVQARLRAEHRFKVASERLRMEDEITTISKQLSTVLADKIGKQCTRRVPASYENVEYPAAIAQCFGKNNVVEGSFEHMFLDCNLSFSLDDTNVDANDDCNMRYGLKSVAPQSQKIDSELNLEEINVSDSSSSQTETIPADSAQPIVKNMGLNDISMTKGMSKNIAPNDFYLAYIQKYDLGGTHD